MKRIIITLFFFLIWVSTFAQNLDPQMLKLGWTLTSPLILNKIK